MPQRTEVSPGTDRRESRALGPAEVHLPSLAPGCPLGWGLALPAAHLFRGSAIAHDPLLTSPAPSPSLDQHYNQSKEERPCLRASGYQPCPIQLALSYRLRSLAGDLAQPRACQGEAAQNGGVGAARGQRWVLSDPQTAGGSQRPGRRKWHLLSPGPLGVLEWWELTYSVLQAGGGSTWGRPEPPRSPQEGSPPHSDSVCLGSSSTPPAHRESFLEGVSGASDPGLRPQRAERALPHRPSTEVTTW